VIRHYKESERENAQSAGVLESYSSSKESGRKVTNAEFPEEDMLGAKRVGCTDS
jgi:hypothetical protein